MCTLYASHHPSYNDGHDRAYPSPVGLFVTSANGDLLGFHAVSLLRVAEDDQGGEMRAYFQDQVERVTRAARASWGSSYGWLGPIVG